MKQPNLLVHLGVVAAVALTLTACGRDRDRVAKNGTMNNAATGMNENSSADRTAGNVASKDLDFFTKAAQGGMAEVEIARLVEQKSANAHVKEFARKLLDDHTKANDELKQLAANQNVTLPTELDSHSRSEIDKLNKLNGPDFDREFIKHSIDDHKEDIDRFTKEAKDGDDPALKTFAGNQLPHLTQHLELAQNIYDNWKGHADRRSR